MTTIRSHTVLDHDADTVWSLVRQIGDVADWFPSMSHSEATADGRVVTLADGARLDEVTVTLDDRLRRYQYRITGGDVEVVEHLGTIDVIDLGDGRSVLVYGSNVVPAEVAEAFDVAIGEAVAGLGDHLAAARNSSE